MGWVTASRRRGRSSAGGVALAVAALALMPLTRSPPPEIWLAAGLMAMAGALRDHPAARRWWALAAIAAALSLGAATRSFAPPWLAATTGLGALVTMHLLDSFEGRHAVRGLVPGLFAISALGVYSTVPDTEEALILAAVAASGGLLANLGLPLPFGAAGSGALAVVYWWTVAAGGVGRDGSVVGAAACLGLFVAEPAAWWLAARRERRSSRWAPSRILWFAVQALAAVLCGRVAGLRSGALEAGFVAAPVWLGLVFVAGLLGRGVSREGVAGDRHTAPRARVGQSIDS